MSHTFRCDNCDQPFSVSVWGCPVEIKGYMFGPHRVFCSVECYEAGVRETGIRTQACHCCPEQDDLPPKWVNSICPTCVVRRHVQRSERECSNCTVKDERINELMDLVSMWHTRWAQAVRLTPEFIEKSLRQCAMCWVSTERLYNGLCAKCRVEELEAKYEKATTP